MAVEQHGLANTYKPRQQTREQQLRNLATKNRDDTSGSSFLTLIAVSEKAMETVLDDQKRQNSGLEDLRPILQASGNPVCKEYQESPASDDIRNTPSEQVSVLTNIHGMKTPCYSLLSGEYRGPFDASPKPTRIREMLILQESVGLDLQGRIP